MWTRQGIFKNLIFQVLHHYIIVYMPAFCFIHFLHCHCVDSVTVVCDMKIIYIYTVGYGRFSFKKITKNSSKWCILNMQSTLKNSSYQILVNVWQMYPVIDSRNNWKGRHLYFHRSIKAHRQWIKKNLHNLELLKLHISVIFFTFNQHVHISKTRCLKPQWEQQFSVLTAYSRHRPRVADPPDIRSTRRLVTFCLFSPTFFASIKRISVPVNEY